MGVSLYSMAVDGHLGRYINYSPYFPNFFTCVKEIAIQFKSELVERFPTTDNLFDWLREVWEWHYTSFYWNLSQVGYIILIAVILTLIRLIATKYLFEPLPRAFKVIEHDVKKFPESAFKFIIYSILWGWAVYLCLVNEKKYFFYPMNHWNDWAPGMTVPPEIYWLFMFQMGFYVHCIYATLFVEVIRKDFAVMMIHHFLTLGLLSYSIGVRFHIIGLLVLFVQDFGDVSLEISKMIFYFKTRDNIKCEITEQMSNVSFAVFTVQWILLRLYWFPTKVLYSSCYVCIQAYPKGPFYLSFNILLMVLYFMQVYWFSFIVRLLVKMVVSGEVSVKDTRETKEEEDAWARAMKEHKKIEGKRKKKAKR